MLNSIYWICTTEKKNILNGKKADNTNIHSEINEDLEQK